MVFEAQSEYPCPCPTMAPVCPFLFNTFLATHAVGGYSQLSACWRSLQLYSLAELSTPYARQLKQRGRERWQHSVGWGASTAHQFRSMLRGKEPIGAGFSHCFLLWIFSICCWTVEWDFGKGAGRKYVLHRRLD